MTYVILNGAIDYDDPNNMFDLNVTDVSMDYVDLAGSCPLPNGGTVVVTFNNTTVTIEFDEDTPETGYATVTCGELSGDVPICDYMGAF